MFKKETNSVLYPDSLGPRKIRRAVVDFSNFSVFPWFNHFVFVHPLWPQEFISFEMTSNCLKEAVNSMASCIYTALVTAHPPIL